MRARHPDVLIGLEAPADAGVFRISDSLALVQSVDVIAPVLDNPYQFGQIAAANALSDLYAMGATPKTALNIAVFPRELSTTGLHEVLRGSDEKVREAGAATIGGHTVDGNQLWFGLAVTGVTTSARYVDAPPPAPGERLILTKRLGAGILITAYRKKLIEEDSLRQAIASMTSLNDRAAQIATQFGAAILTDISGFGLAGHLLLVARKYGLGVRVESARLPVFDLVFPLAKRGVATSLAVKNGAAFAPSIATERPCPPEVMSLLYDPQTSGGLLLAVCPERYSAVVAALEQSGCEAADIGEFVVAETPQIWLAS